MCQATSGGERKYAEFRNGLRVEGIADKMTPFQVEAGMTAPLLRGLNWPYKRNALDDAFPAELGAGVAEGAAALAEQVAPACRGALMSLPKEED